MALKQTGSIPVPDPTELTSRAVETVKRDMELLFNVRHEALEDMIDEKFRGRDTALAAALKAAQELVAQQNLSNAIAADKAEKSFAEQIRALTIRFDDLKEAMAKIDKRDYSTVGAYIIGAIGIAALIVAALTHWR